MPVDPQLRTLKIDIPTKPDALVELSLMLADDQVNLQAMSALIASDMALAAAVLKAVNSSLYGLNGRVQTVKQAITYLGTREVAAVTFAMGLKAVFPHMPELDPVWDRANVRGMLMGRLARAVDVDHWIAHSAGLFEECGKAVLLRHAPDRYREMLNTAGSDDQELILLEHAEFGVSHEALGAALCETWGLAPMAVDCVRFHVVVNATGEYPRTVHKPSVCMLSAIANALMNDPDTVDAAVTRLAPGAGFETETVLGAVRDVQRKLEAAMDRQQTTIS